MGAKPLHSRIIAGFIRLIGAIDALQAEEQPCP